MLQIVVLAIIFSFFHGCSSVGTLNLKEHEFGRKGQKLIWFQVAGLSQEHMALLKFSLDSSDTKIPFENFLCSGNLWSFNLFDLRPTPYAGMLSQLTGSKDIEQSCKDIKHEPLWKYLNKSGFRFGVLETPMKASQSLETLSQCQDNYLDDIALWKMGKSLSKNKKKFHHEEPISIANGVYEDKTCHNNECFVSLVTNTNVIWEKLTEENGPKALLIRDFRLYNELKKKNIHKAKLVLREISKAIAFFQQKAKVDSQLSLIVSSSGAIPVEFPKKGRDWDEFEKSGKGVIFKNQSLLSSVWAMGPGAENFCGVYKESQMLKRILWTPKIDPAQFLKKYFSEGS